MKGREREKANFVIRSLKTVVALHTGFISLALLAYPYNVVPEKRFLADLSENKGC